MRGLEIIEHFKNEPSSLDSLLSLNGDEKSVSLAKAELLAIKEQLPACVCHLVGDLAVHVPAVLVPLLGQEGHGLVRSN